MMRLLDRLRRALLRLAAPRRALLRLAAPRKKPPAPSLRRSAARKALQLHIAETTNSAKGALSRE